MEWLMLLGAGFAEVGFTTAMKVSQDFRKLIPSVFFLVFAALSFGLLSAAMRTIPLGTAYAVWTGIGAVGTAIIGIVAFGDGAKPARLALLTLLVVALVGLKMVS